MPEFVNFNKRGVCLPDGCKDLADVIERENALRVAAGGSDFHVTSWHSRVGKLREIDTHIEGIRQSTEVASRIRIATPDYQISIDTSCTPENKPQWCMASMHNLPGSPTLKNLREFLARLGKPFSDLALTDAPLIQVPLWSDAADFTKLASDLFREVGGLDESSDLCFEQTEQFTPEGRKGRDEV